VSDLERFFAQLVRNLAALNPARLRQPLTLAEIRESIIPYRANRRALELESSEDYELIVLRLCAGEGGFAITEPEEAHADFVKEAGSPNPDLTIVEKHRKAVVGLDPRSVAKALDPKPELAYAPWEEQVSQAELARKAEAAAAERAPPVPDLRCTHCRAALPVGRVVNFCPKCGQSQLRCPKCKTELERGWRHCVGCGAAVGEA
jgi:double zinc ribbon protein